MKKKNLLFLVVLALSLVGCSNTASSTTTSTDSSSTTSSSDTSPVIDFDINERIAGAKDEETYNLALESFLTILKNYSGQEDSTLDDVQPVHFFGGYGENKHIYVLLSKNEIFSIIAPVCDWGVSFLEYTVIVDLPSPVFVNGAQYNHKAYIFFRYQQIHEIVVVHQNRPYGLMEAYLAGLLGLGEMNDIYYQYITNIEFNEFDMTNLSSIIILIY